MRMIFALFLMFPMIAMAHTEADVGPPADLESFVEAGPDAEGVPGCDFPVVQQTFPESINAQGISKVSFDSAIALANRHYAPIFAAKGCPLVIHDSWSSGTVNAQAWRQGGKCHVEMFGGFARFPGMTKNSFLAVLCHEIGHHLGGQPRYGRGSEWASVEGQSDYYATLSCMKRLGKPSMNASMALATALAKLSGEARLPSRATRDTSQVSRTYEGHPRAQCRLDTMDNGRVGAARPRCWYKP